MLFSSKLVDDDDLEDLLLGKNFRSCILHLYFLLQKKYYYSNTKTITIIIEIYTQTTYKI